MVRNCCFCISNRTATAIAATFIVLRYVFAMGIVLHPEVRSIPGLTFYRLAAFVAAICGLLGVQKNNAKYVKVFSVFYWFEWTMSFVAMIAILVLGVIYKKEAIDSVCDDPAECEEYYAPFLAAIVTYFFIVVMVDLNLALSIHSFWKDLQRTAEYRSENAHEAYTIYYAPVGSEDVSGPYVDDDGAKQAPPPAYEHVVKGNSSSQV